MKNSQKILKNKKENLKENNIISKAHILKTSDFYIALKEEIDAVRVETVFNAQEILLKGKFEIGELISKNVSKEFKITELVHYLSEDLKFSERELWYCVKYYEQFKVLEKNPEFTQKNISWNKVKKMISAPEEEKACMHKQTKMIKVCIDCNKRVD